MRTRRSTQEGASSGAPTSQPAAETPTPMPPKLLGAKPDDVPINAGLMSNAGATLKRYIDRIENVNAEIAELTDDRKEIFAEAKADGFDTKIIRKIIQRRKIASDLRYIEDNKLDQYEASLGMLLPAESDR